MDIHNIWKEIMKKTDTEEFKYEINKKEDSINNIELALIKLSKDLENAN